MNPSLAPMEKGPAISQVGMVGVSERVGSMGGVAVGEAGVGVEAVAVEREKKKEKSDHKSNP